MIFQMKGVQKIMTKDAKRYYSDIKTLIPSKGKYERDLLKKTKARIIELDSTHENITYTTLEEILGSPTDLINEYYANVDTTYLLKRLRTTNVIRRIIYIILILAVLAYTITTCTYIKYVHDAKEAFINREIIIIE